jgi:PAS domain-containing protein
VTRSELTPSAGRLTSAPGALEPASAAGSRRASAATAALELLPDGVLVVCDGEVVLANRAFARLTGADPTGHAAPDWLPAGALDAEQASWVRHHHERHDGTGYPDRLAGDAIPDGAALIAIADAWDTLTSGRPYRAPLSHDDALRAVDADAGTRLTPAAGTLLRAALVWLGRPRERSG